MNKRWSTAIHESGHACTALALGGAATRLSLGEDGSGLCHFEAVNQNDAAFVAAAGPLAEKLLADFPSPADEGEQHEPQAKRILPAPFEEADRPFVAARDITLGLETPSDARRLALWAITGFEDEPERWVERLVFADHVAGQIVADHEAAIVRIATALFFRTTIFQEEILAAFKGTTE